MFNPFVKKVYFDKRTFKRLVLIFLKLNLFKNVDLQIVEYLKPLAKLGINYDGLGTQIFVPDNIKNKVSKMLGAKIRDMDKKILIGMVPSAQWPGKRWSSSNFKALAGMIAERFNANIIVVGGKRDSFCDEIASVDNNVHSFAGELSMIESASVLSFCDLVVSNDTGMMHVAEAVDTDVIGIMGPTSYEFGCYPYRETSRVVELDMWCRPCSKNGRGPCIKWGKRPCLNDISPDMVFDEVFDYFKVREN
jgi:heptosyltransferase-2